MSGMSEKSQLVLMQDGKCFFCRRRVKLTHANDGLQATIDHFIPKSRAGQNDFHNKVICCLECNQQKNDRMPTPEEAIRFMLMRRKHGLHVIGAILDIVIDGARRPKLELVHTA